MKRQISRKAIVTAITALCVWSSQASAIDSKDGIFNCKIYSQSTTGTKYYLRHVKDAAPTSVLGVLKYTRDANKASKFAFTRKDKWKHDYEGTMYYMTTGPNGGCVGLPASVTRQAPGVRIQTGWNCGEFDSKRVVVEYFDNNQLVFRVGSSALFFDGWGGLKEGNDLRTNSPFSGFGVNQRFRTSGCRAADNGGHRPKGGTNKLFPGRK